MLHPRAGMWTSVRRSPVCGRPTPSGQCRAGRHFCAWVGAVFAGVVVVMVPVQCGAGIAGFARAHNRLGLGSLPSAPSCGIAQCGHSIGRMCPAWVNFPAIVGGGDSLGVFRGKCVQSGYPSSVDTQMLLPKTACSPNIQYMVEPLSTFEPGPGCANCHSPERWESRVRRCCAVRCAPMRISARFAVGDHRIPI